MFDFRTLFGESSTKNGLFYGPWALISIIWRFLKMRDPQNQGFQYPKWPNLGYMNIFQGYPHFRKPPYVTSYQRLWVKVKTYQILPDRRSMGHFEYQSSKSRVALSLGGHKFRFMGIYRSIVGNHYYGMDDLKHPMFGTIRRCRIYIGKGFSLCARK